MICSPVLIESEPFEWALFKDVEAGELIDPAVTLLSGVVSGARPTFCMTEADMIGEAGDIELIVMTSMYCLRCCGPCAVPRRGGVRQTSTTARIPRSLQR